MYYAQITSGTVTAVTETSGPIDATDMIEIQSLDASLLGQSYADGVFTPAAPGPRPAISKRAFLKLFTPAEYGAIKDAAAVNTTLDYFWQQFILAEFISMDDPDTIGGINMLRAIGLLTVERAAEILA